MFSTLKEYKRALPRGRGGGEAWAEKKMEAWPVSLRVNGLKHPGAELVGPVLENQPSPFNSPWTSSW